MVFGYTFHIIYTYCADCSVTSLGEKYEKDEKKKGREGEM
jgi:hypothetical protein